MSVSDLSTQRILTLQQPPRLVFGAGCAAGGVDELRRLGASRVLVVTSPSAERAAGEFLGLLSSAFAEVVILREAPAEPTLGDFARLRAEAERHAIDAVVGIGGGSVLDVAKLVAALHRTGRPVGSFFGSGLLQGRGPRLVCLPTTAGSGSEVSPNAVLLDEREQLKKAVISPWLLADAAFVDPVLTVSAPPALTASTGMDALAHCLEAFANRQAHPITDRFALEGVRLIGEHLPRAVARGDDLEARSAVALGSLYGGLCLGPVNTAAVHALAYPLGGEFRLSHGLSNALLLPHVVRFNLPAAPGRYAAIARALGVELPGADDSTLAAAGADRLAALAAACGLPPGLAACGVPTDAVPRMAAAAMKVTRLLANNPRDLAARDAEAIYRAAF